MKFSVLNVGQFADVSVEFGDLTLLVGAQGTGKSVFCSFSSSLRIRSM
ncbi:ATP-binding protein [Dethiosulfovibrio salsuginis]|uniref:Uncharacterized protein n=1 Tax=Dethiosulfovibrio salsuginis TaxID=561720 RepID=A0A1X7IH02_9BACT|nr:ATP-binding protein [Dethiosulfovibrio salsuginis]SMG14091.1 hypothetical protein SAMN06275492_10258 [Dethiosulfovibrio salsuginis]